MPNVERCLKCGGQGYRLDPVVFDKPEKCTACDGSGHAVEADDRPVSIDPLKKEIE